MGKIPITDSTKQKQKWRFYRNCFWLRALNSKCSVVCSLISTQCVCRAVPAVALSILLTIIFRQPDFVTTGAIKLIKKLSSNIVENVQMKWQFYKQLKIHRDFTSTARYYIIDWSKLISTAVRIYHRDFLSIGMRLTTEDFRAGYNNPHFHFHRFSWIFVALYVCLFVGLFVCLFVKLCLFLNNQ